MGTKILKNGDLKKWLEHADPRELVDTILRRELSHMIFKNELDHKDIIAFERLSEIARKASQAEREEIIFFKRLGLSGNEVDSKKMKQLEKAMEESELEDIDLQLRAALGEPEENNDD